MKLLVTGGWRDAQNHINDLAAMGHEVVFLHNEADALPCDPAEIEGVIGAHLFDHHPIEPFSALRFIQIESAGFDHMPMEYIRAHGIEFHNAKGVYAAPMAEWTVMRLLELNRHAAALFEKQNTHVWEKDRSWVELTGKTVCIVGFGEYGKETAKRLKAFGVCVSVVSRTKPTDENVDVWRPMSALHEALGEADYVMLAIALNAETRHFFGCDQFAAMKPTACFINAARGALVDEPALIEALQNGKIAAAALDVFETEPLPPDSPLWTMEDVLLSPHNSYVGDRAGERLWSAIKDNLRNEER